MKINAECQRYFDSLQWADGVISKTVLANLCRGREQLLRRFQQILLHFKELST